MFRITVLRGVAVFFLLACGCMPKGPVSLAGTQRQRVEQHFAKGRWHEALRTCAGVLKTNPDDCAARYCELLGQTMVFVDELNSYVLPRFHQGGRAGLSDLFHLWKLQRQLARATRAADETAARTCEFQVPSVPLLIGDPSDPIVQGEMRGQWTTRDAHTLGAILYAFRYLYGNVLHHSPVPPPRDGDRLPGMPAYLERMMQHLVAQEQLLRRPADPSVKRGGWYERDGDGAVSSGDELLIDIFRPGTDQRVFDFSRARFASAQALPLGALTATEALPPARCGYQRWHIETLFHGKQVGGTDGMSFSPDGSRLVLPLRRGDRYQIYVTGEGGKDTVCLTCGSPGNNDGVRWQPGGDALLFISDRDHPHSQGGSGGGVGQELYVMRRDGSRQTRLTRSGAWATNYHANWSMDGKQIVWGNTQERTWDVMVADYVDDPAGPRLDNVRRLTHDTTWWETHGFTPDGKAVIVTNTAAGMMSSDIYAIDIQTGKRTRLTDDPAWDEHAHLSPDGRKLAWISGRWQPASVFRLNAAGLSPIFDFFWIVPGVFFEIINHPAGHATELSLMDADGSHVQRLTFEGEVAADNQWSPDGRRIVFRQQQPRVFGPGRIRVLTFDDCR